MFLERPDGLWTIQQCGGSLSFARPPSYDGNHAAAPLEMEAVRSDSVANTIFPMVDDERGRLLVTAELGGCFPVRWSDPSSSAAIVPLLVRELGDREHFAIAHLVLVQRTTKQPAISVTEVEGRFVAEIDHLRINMISRDTLRDGGEWPRPFANADQIPTIRRLWADRLNVPAYAVSFWHICAFFAVLPAFQLTRWLLRRLRRSRRQRGGMCVACGFDLRVTPDRCPECGHVAELQIV
jgi:hypothetical protein